MGNGFNNATLPVVTALFSVAAGLAFVVGLLHSVLGERYLLMRLLHRPNLPHLFGGPEFTARTLRFAWHLTTVAWWGFAAILVLLAGGSISPKSVSGVVAVTFLLTGAVTLIISRGRHLAWIAFILIGAACSYAAATC